MFTFLDSTGAGMGATGTWGTIIMIVIMFAVFYFFALFLSFFLEPIFISPLANIGIIHI